MRTRLIKTVPAVRGYALRIQLDAQHQIAKHLVEAFPDRLDRVSAAALTGAFVGAVTAALEAQLEDIDLAEPATAKTAIRSATEVALAPWREHLERRRTR